MTVVTVVAMINMGQLPTKHWVAMVVEIAAVCGCCSG